jgi:mannosylfructose-phosphate synthase
MTELLLNAASPLRRIAMVSTHGYVAANPPLGAVDTGGQVVYVLELAKKIAQLGYEVDIWTRRFEEQPELEAVSERVRIIRVPCGGAAFIPKEYLCDSLAEWCVHALRFIKRHGLVYELINSHYWDAGMAAQTVAEAMRAPHLHTPHSLGLWKQRQMERDYPEDAEKFEAQYNFKRRINEERRLYQACSLVIATTPPQLDLITQDYGIPAAKVRMIPPGYDDTRFYPVGAASRDAIRRRLEFRGKVVLALGRLARNKGYDLLIDAFAVLAKREPLAVLYLAVGGEHLTPREAAILKKLKARAAASSYADRIRISGFIPEFELPDYYRAADIFVLCSRYEPFGMTAIEAMASGTPTVVTIHGGLYRAVSFGRHALYADPFDPEDLGIVMAKLFRHPRLSERLSRMGAHKARSLFTWTGIAQQLIAAVEGTPVAAVTLDDKEWDEPWTDGD